jgi:hypothetical protein
VAQLGIVTARARKKCVLSADEEHTSNAISGPSTKRPEAASGRGSRVLVYAYGADTWTLICSVCIPFAAWPESDSLRALAKEAAGR